MSINVDFLEQPHDNRVYCKFCKGNIGFTAFNRTLADVARDSGHLCPGVMEMNVKWGVLDELTALNDNIRTILNYGITVSR